MPAAVDYDSEGQEDEMEEFEEELDEGQLGDEDAGEGQEEDGNQQNSQKADPESKILDTTDVNQSQPTGLVKDDGPDGSSATPAAGE